MPRMQAAPVWLKRDLRLRDGEPSSLARPVAGAAQQRHGSRKGGLFR